MTRAGLVRAATGLAVADVGGAGAAARSASIQIARTLGGGDAPFDLAVVFLGGAVADGADDVVRGVRDVLRPRCLLGVTAQAVIAGGREVERPDAVAVWAAHLPGARLEPLRFPPPQEAAVVPDDAASGSGVHGWPALPDAGALLVLADPFTFPVDAFLAWTQQARPNVPVCGGLASGSGGPGGSRLLLDGEVHADGAVAVALGGVRLRTLVSQGCRPVGPAWVVTRAEQNLIFELGGEPPAERLRELYSEAEPADQELMRRGLHVGIAIDEYADEHGRGDFVVRGVLGADAETGALAVGDVVRVGQTVRFHVRDAGSADEDLRVLLGDFARGGAPAAALLFTCNGRGARLFGEPDHDAELVRTVLGPVPMAGFFCAGELGPVGGRNLLHGFTASILAFDTTPPQAQAADPTDEACSEM